MVGKARVSTALFSATSANDSGRIDIFDTKIHLKLLSPVPSIFSPHAGHATPRLAPIFWTLLFMLLTASLFSQETPWTVESTHDGKVEVLSRIWEEEDAEGDEYQVIEYKVTTTTKVSIEKLKALLYDADRHKEFMPDTEISRKLKIYSTNKWLMYYYFDSPWPLPDSDCVTIMTMTEDVANKSVRFDGIAHAELHPMTEDRRMDKFEISYTFTAQGDSTLLVVHSIMTPVIHAPDWLVNVWFPDGPADLVMDLIEKAKL